MRYLEVPILCHTAQSAELKDLGLNITGSEYEPRTGCINADLITGFYPDSDNVETIVQYGGTDFTVCLKYDEFKKQLFACK